MWNSLKRSFKLKSQPVIDKLQQIKERLHKYFFIRLVVGTIQQLGEDEATQRSASIAYYATLSIFPLILGLIAILGLFLPSETLQEDIFDFFERNLPGAIDVLEQNIDSVIKYRGQIGAVSLLLLFWSASAMFGAINRSINRVWGIKKDRPFYIRKLHDIGMGLGVGVLFLLSMAATSIFSILNNLDVAIANFAADFGAKLFGFLSSFVIFLILFKYIPNTKTYWRYIWPGAVLSAVLFEIVKLMFLFYLDNIANFESVYGSVASVIVLLLWIYITAFILILGAEFSWEYERLQEEVKQTVSIDTKSSNSQDISEQGINAER